MLRSTVTIALVTALASAGFVAAPRPARAQGTAPVDEARKPKLTRPPELVRFVEAGYPESEKAAGKSASVVVQIAISATGTVDDVTVLESAGAAFDAAAVAAVRQFVFRPAEIDDRPAAIRIHYRYQFVLKEALPTDAVFTGVVRVAGTGEPLAGVSVDLDGGEHAVTDAEGRFRLEKIAPGSHRVILAREDLKAMQTEEVFEAGKQVDAVYEVEREAPPAAGEDADDLEIVVVAPKLTKQVVSTVIEADQAKRVAGTQGDVLKVVENMPGVTRATAGSGAVVVWGAAPEDTRVYVDSVRIPLLYHFGGLRSVVHTDVVQNVELIPGGYGSTYGRGLGGLVTVEKRRPAEDRIHGTVQLDFLDASASVSGPVADRWRVQAAVRRSHLDRLLERVTDEDVGEFFPVPRYHDAQASVRFQATQGEWAELGGLLSSDSVARVVSSVDPAQRKKETRDLAFERIYVRYEKLPGDGSQIAVVPWVGRDRSSRVAHFGGTPTSLDARSTSYGLRASYRGPVASFLTGAVGLDLEATSSDLRRSGSITSPPREGDAHVFGQPPSDQVNGDAWDAVVGSAAPYVEGDFGLFEDTLHVVPGMRLEPFFVSVSHRLPSTGDSPGVGAYSADVLLEPRLSVRYTPHRRVTFKGAYGKYGQPPLAEDLSPVFGNPLLAPSTATHLLGGVSVDVFGLATAETTVFTSRSEELSVRNPAKAPLVAQALVNEGEGRSTGMQVLLRRDLSRGFFGWVAYTLLRSERKDTKDGEWRPFDFDQTHVLTALASYDLGYGFDVGGRVRYATGFPRTPVKGAFYDARRDLYEPVLGQKNGERIPDFVQLDVRVAKRFTIGPTGLEIYLDVQNVTDRENPEEIVYSADYSQKRYIRGFPILPILGAKWSY